MKRLAIVLALFACSSHKPATSSTQTPPPPAGSGSTTPASTTTGSAERMAPPPADASPPDAAIDAPPKCPPKKNPDACPATEPNVNVPCTQRDLECSYGAGCCPTTYVCNARKKFEARITSCTP